MQCWQQALDFDATWGWRGGVGGGALKKGLYGEDLPPRFKPHP